MTEDPRSVEGLPVTREDVRVAASYVLDHPGADGVEVLVSGSTVGLTRYAHSAIIQNTVRHEIRANIRLHVGERVASASTNQLDAASMSATADRALEAARTAPIDPDFPGFASPDLAGQADPILRWDAATVLSSPAERAAAVSAIVGVVDEGDAAGIFETGGHAYGLVSSAGVDRFDAFTRASTTCLADLGGATGWGEASAAEISGIDPVAVAKRSIRKARAGRDARDGEPGRHEVVLEASAVAVMLDYLAYAGFGAKQVIDGDSFLSSRSGERVAPAHVTISDDVRHSKSVGIGFDFEGSVRRRVPVIDEGVALAPVTDMRTGRQLGVPSTGHHSGSAEYGPYAANVVLEGGSSSLEDLIGRVEDGYLVTRFHYVNILDRPSTLLTGMTRDGTFRIRNGELAEPVHNFRFAQSALGVLASTLEIGSEIHSVAPEFGYFGSVAAPALRVGDFNFASTTSH